MSLNIRALIQRPKINVADIAQIALDSQAKLSEVRGKLLAPDRKKVAPQFTIGQVATMFDTTKPKIEYAIKKLGLEIASVSGRMRTFKLDEVQELARAVRDKDYQRPDGANAVTIAVCNFKGGVTKTTTTMCLAQGLSLRGHKVLCIDLDPQGSLTTLCGIDCATEVTEEMTAGVILVDLDDEDGDEPQEGEVEPKRDLASAVQKTYWPGIDVVCANTTLYSAEFTLPSKQLRDPSFEFWDVLNKGMADLREQYDVILIDTPPALSYLTINGLMAADGLIVPLPPNNLDFASSVHFWNLFSDLSSGLMSTFGLDKKFDFLNILLAKVDSSDGSSSIVREWIQATYADKVLPVEVPKTSVTVNTSTEYQTPYDITKYEGSAKTYRRARVAYDRVADLIELAVVTSWHQQIAVAD